MISKILKLLVATKKLCKANTVRAKPKTFERVGNIFYLKIFFMKKSRIFMAVGALTLLIASVFATKANKKAGNYVGHIYVASGGAELASGVTCFDNSANFTLTASGTPLTVQGNALYGFTTASSFKPIYY